jgi:hypothetical protein
MDGEQTVVQCLSAAQTTLIYLSFIVWKTSGGSSSHRMNRVNDLRFSQTHRRGARGGTPRCSLSLSGSGRFPGAQPTPNVKRCPLQLWQTGCV